MGNFKIREFRKAKNILQEDFAAIIGLTQSNLSRYETNGVDLTDDMITKLRARYGDEIDGYFTDSSEQIRDKSVPEQQTSSLTMLDMVTVIKKQNDTICKQVETQNEFARQLTSMNERLLNLLEKISFE
jgi:transcriptional regulator with XRE-family HTH domain